MKRERRFALGLILFMVGAGILLLTFYYYWHQTSLIGADATTAAISGTGPGFFVEFAKYIGAILGGALVIAAVYVVLTAL